MPVLTKKQIDGFNRDGYLLLENAISEHKLALLRKDIDRWVEESKRESENYGVTLDGRPRFSLQPGHSAERPALRRIASPTELSDHYLDAHKTASRLRA